MMPRRAPHQPTLRTLALAGLVPLIVFALTTSLAILVTLEGMRARFWIMEEAAKSGTLSPESIGHLAGWLRARMTTLAWTQGSLAMGAIALMLWVQLKLKARLGRISTYVERRLKGDRPAHPLQQDNTVLGRVERRVDDLAEAMSGREEALKSEVGRRRFEARLQRALEMARSEEEVYNVTGIAARDTLPGWSLQLIMADNSRAHLRPVLCHECDDAGGCPVVEPRSCPAISEGRVRLFASSEDLDACPRLRDHGTIGCSAACFPVNVMGRAVGVLHAFGPEGVLPTDAQRQAVTVVAGQSGTRMGMLRTLASTELQATTDPLTGLLNRRSFESAATRELKVVGAGAIVICDLDHFKILNDTHGHQAGDRALRLFSQILKRSLKRNDIIGRYGGEEFVILLGDCGPDDARTILARVRQTLHEALAQSATPRFTASFGVAIAPEHGTDLDELIRQADRAMYEAKRGGRDRVMMAGRQTDEAPAIEEVA